MAAVYPQASLAQPAPAYAPGTAYGAGALRGNNYAGAAYGAQPGAAMGSVAGGLPAMGYGAAGPANASVAGGVGGMGGYRM